MIGERIKGLREQKGYSISKLAELAGVSKSYLSYIERNMQNNPSLQVLSRIASHLDSTIEYLLGENIQLKERRDALLDEDWGRILRDAVDEGMSKSDFQALKVLVQSTKWKEVTSEARSHPDRSRTSNIFIVHIDN